MAAFRSEPSRGGSKLFPVELEGKGRVLIDIPADDHTISGTPETLPSKKRTGNRRKKKGTETASVGKKIPGFVDNVEDTLVKPNWPDSEFPWRLRTEERVEMAKAEQEERLRWIERFLDRDSDDEEDAHKLADQEADEGGAVPKPKLGTVCQHESVPLKMGRGKMVPLLAYPSDDIGKHSGFRRIVFPSDPADARVALLSKKTVRALSYRQQRRYRAGDDEDEAVCICNGKDDGRELVQCDNCQTWYHLHCIGIKDIAELGREEDPWFCSGCIARGRSPSTEPDNFIVREPTLVPTDSSAMHRHRPEDMPFYQPLPQESPNWHSSRIPKTPTRVAYNSHPESNHSLSSWIDSDSSRPGPSTPRHYTQTVGVFTTPGPFDVYNLEESPFDPTSTPSRGIKFNAPFATPKSNVWPARINGLFQTPSRGGGRGLPNKTFGGPGSLSAVLDDKDLASANSNYDHFGRMLYDESPIRRNKTNSTVATRRTLHSPSRLPTSGTTLTFLQESPIMRSSLPVSHNQMLSEEGM